MRKKRLSDFSFYFKFKILRGGGNFLEFLRVFDKGKWWILEYWMDNLLFGKNIIEREKEDWLGGWEEEEEEEED